LKNLNNYKYLFIFSLLISGPATAAEKGLTPLFADDQPLSITIDAPFTTLMEYLPDKAELKGTLSYTQADGSERHIGLKLRTRGNYRRDKSHCNFAPIRLNLKKNDAIGTLFHGQDKLKLVTHCRSGDPGYELLVLREYLAYRLFQELTDISYGTRLLNVTYFDTEDRKKLTKLGFIIEDDSDVARRNGLKRVKTKYLTHDSIDHKRQNLIHVFEYMIGNTEYSLMNPEPGKNCCHNTDVMSPTGDEPYLHIPFDFDFAGMVNASYAQPNPKYPIREVRIRHYKGICSNNELLPETLELFHAKREDLYAAIAAAGSTPRLERTTRAVRKYVEAFYKIIDDPDAVQKKLIDKCYDPGTN
jgi:hypothetical protein